MQIDESLCLKFPAALREKLLNGEIEFPSTTQFEYEALYTYRAVERTEDDNRAITIDDFRSYFELNKKPKKVRGVSADFAKDPHYYGVSSFLNKEIVEQKMKFPNPRKKLAAGFVRSVGGPQNTVDQHVCWWLYEGADVGGFEIMEKGDVGDE